MPYVDFFGVTHPDPEMGPFNIQGPRTPYSGWQPGLPENAWAPRPTHDPKARIGPIPNYPDPVTPPFGPIPNVTPPKPPIIPRPNFLPERPGKRTNPFFDGVPGIPHPFQPYVPETSPISSTPTLTPPAPPAPPALRDIGRDPFGIFSPWGQRGLRQEIGPVRVQGLFDHGNPAPPAFPDITDSPDHGLVAGAAGGPGGASGAPGPGPGPSGGGGSSGDNGVGDE
jgi:hypothetical protein